MHLANLSALALLALVATPSAVNRSPAAGGAPKIYLIDPRSRGLQAPRHLRVGNRTRKPHQIQP